MYYVNFKGTTKKQDKYIKLCGLNIQYMYINK